MQLEQWLPVPGFDGYEVSDLGRVRSSVVRSDCVNPWRHRHRVRDRILKTTSNGRGYRRLGLRGKDGKVDCYVHRLVLEAFVGPCPEDMEACHNNGERADNRLTNLRWDTRVANSGDRALHGTLVQGERHPSSKLTEQDIHEMRSLHADGMSLGELSARFVTSKGNVCTIVHRKKWKHLTEQVPCS